MSDVECVGCHGVRAEMYFKECWCAVWMHLLNVLSMFFD